MVHDMNLFEVKSRPIHGALGQLQTRGDHPGRGIVQAKKDRRHLDPSLDGQRDAPIGMLHSSSPCLEVFLEDGRPAVKDLFGGPGRNRTLRPRACYCARSATELLALKDENQGARSRRQAKHSNSHGDPLALS
jgi:hypothetical protein